MYSRSRLFKLCAMLLATVHLTGAELAGVTHGVCAYHADQHQAQTAESSGHAATAAHSGAATDHPATGSTDFHCTSSCCCSVVAAPAALGSFGLLHTLEEVPQRSSDIIAGRRALPRDPYVLPFATAPPVGR